MEYIIHKRFKTKAICGDVNLPAGTVCHSLEGAIFYKGRPLCMAASESGHQYFARNDDGKGLERGKFTREIIKFTQKQDDNIHGQVDAIWEDAVCQKYKRHEHPDVWLWNHDFYNADIEDLKYIASLIGLKVKI